MQNKKVKHRPLTKYLHFHKITGPTLFVSGENKRKIKKKASTTYRPIFFQHVSGNAAIFLRLSSSNASTHFKKSDILKINVYLMNFDKVLQL